MKTTGSIRLALVLLLQLLCLIALGCAALTKGESLKVYALRCAEAIAPVAPFNCMQGEVIPITVNGQEPRAYTPDMTCDRPSLLPLGRQSDGQCVPYSRAILLADGET